MHSARRDPGFSLVEILIVISIIAILMGLITKAVIHARGEARNAQARNIAGALTGALEDFYQDEGYYPRREYAPDENAMPALFEALLGDAPPEGKGGDGAPLTSTSRMPGSGSAIPSRASCAPRASRNAGMPGFPSTSSIPSANPAGTA